MDPIEFLLVVTLLGGDVVRDPATAQDCHFVMQVRQISRAIGQPMVMMTRQDDRPRVVIDVKCTRIDAAPWS